MAGLIELAGTVIDQNALTVPMAADFVRHIGARQDGAIQLVEIRQFDDSDGLVIDVRPELPGRRHYDFRSSERLLILFWRERTLLPWVFSLRRDFPRVPHMNLVKRGSFPWICLFGEDPDEVRQRLTAHTLAERILWWFSENAAGTLHRDDQALEPFLSGSIRPIYFPPSVFEITERLDFSVYGAAIGTEDEVLVADREINVPQELRGSTAALIPLTLPVQTRGVIYEEPETLAELKELCDEAGFDVLTPLIDILRGSFIRKEQASLTILLLRIPKGRTPDASEGTEYRAFRLKPVVNGEARDAGPPRVAVALGLGEMSGGQPIVLLQRPESLLLDQVHVSMLAPMPFIDRKEGALLNGALGPVDLKVFAVGMGALGSQVFAHLVRRGFGSWAIVDSDTLEPHNLARHEVFGRRFGIKKAIEMAVRANELYSGDPVAKPIVTNLNVSSEVERLQSAITEAELILDMSASTAVARELVHGFSAVARRSSLFLSPSGNDLIMLAEDAERELHLDALEAQYLRAVINDSRLRGLLWKPGGRVRVGPGCRDRSARIPNEHISLHAAIGAKAIQLLEAEKGASIIVWRCNQETMEVQRIQIPVSPTTNLAVHDWEVVFDQGFLEKLHAFRNEKLPKETCGVLLGQFDALRRRLYVFDALPAPPDSVEEEDGCKRGVEALKEKVENIREMTGQDADYVGEWHSHPNRASCSPSTRDLAQMLWIEGRMHPAGLPALMLIACQGGRNTVLFGLPGTNRIQL